MADETAVEEPEVLAEPGVIEADADEIEGSLFAEIDEKPADAKEPAKEEPKAEAATEEAEAKTETEEAETKEEGEEKPAEVTEPSKVVEGEDAAKAVVVPSPVDDRLARFRVEGKVDENKVLEAVEEVETRIMPFAKFGNYADEVLKRSPEVRMTFWKYCRDNNLHVPPDAVKELAEFEKNPPAEPAAPMSDVEAEAKYKELLLESEMKANDFLIEHREQKRQRVEETKRQKENRERTQREAADLSIRQEREATQAQRQQLIDVATEYPSVLQYDAAKGFTVKDQAAFDEFCALSNGVSPNTPLKKIMKLTLKDMGKLTEAKKKEEPAPEARPTLGKGKATVPVKKIAKVEPGEIDASDDIIETW